MRLIIMKSLNKINILNNINNKFQPSYKNNSNNSMFKDTNFKNDMARYINNYMNNNLKNYNDE